MCVCITFDHDCEQGPVIDPGKDYSKDRKNDYTAETDDGYVVGGICIQTYIPDLNYFPTNVLCMCISN